MKIEGVYVGTIRKCTKYDHHESFRNETFINGISLGCSGFGHIEVDDEPYKENAMLVKIENGGYVDLGRFNSILDYLKIYKSFTKNGFTLGGLMMSTSAHKLNSLFVDEETLEPYYKNNSKQKNVSMLKLKKQINNR